MAFAPVSGPRIPKALAERMPVAFVGVAKASMGGDWDKVRLVFEYIKSALRMTSAPLYLGGEPGTYNCRGYAIEVGLLLLSGASRDEHGEWRPLAKDLMDWMVEDGSIDALACLEDIDFMCAHSHPPKSDGMVN